MLKMFYAVLEWSRYSGRLVCYSPSFCATGRLFLPACLPACLSVCLPTCLSFCLPASLSVYLSVCLHVDMECVALDIPLKN